MSELPHLAKVRLVTLLAQFSGPTEAAKIVSDEFGVTLDRRTAGKYDPSKRGCQCGPKYRVLFYEVRERWLNDLAAVPIAHQAHRLRTLNRLANKLEDAGDYVGAVNALEQAARELGGYYAKEPPIRPSRYNAIPVANLDGARAELSARIAGLVGRAT